MSDFERVLSVLDELPKSLSREVSRRLRSAGFGQFTPRYTNQVLYRMLGADLVSRDSSGDKPLWSRTGKGARSSKNEPKSTSSKRPLDSRQSDIRMYRIADTDVKVILLDNLSPNDPYMIPDWVGTHVISSVNCNHPFWNSRLTNNTDRALYMMIAAIDAYVLWKIARLSQPPGASETQEIRDNALRFCTLLEAEVAITNG